MMLCLDELFVFLVPRISRSCNCLRKKIFNEDFDGILALGEFEYPPFDYWAPMSYRNQ